MKKIIVLLLAVLTVFPSVSYAENSDGKFFPDSEHWRNITTAEAIELVNNENATGNFVFIYYRDTCGYSTSMLPLIHYYSTINNIDFYALENNSNVPWSWPSTIAKGTITFPLVVVYNKKEGIMAGDSDVHSDEEFRTLIHSAKLNFNFSSQITAKIGSNYVDFNGKKIETDVPATIISDRTMIPVRVISELFGATVKYIEKDVNNKFRVIIQRGNRRIYLFEGYERIDIIIGGEEEQYSIDVAPMIINGRTLVPARALAEALGFTVSWDSIHNQAVFSLD
ncbi:MAG: copper amine oxidase N-terminal domain-containing protein [Clostridia bacterium]|nr:copper amine oxidase N-terminal domain-containing protein [Clostridia bacterium]